MRPRTRAVHAGARQPERGRPAEASPAIHPASAPLFAALDDLEAAYEGDTFVYRRYGSPNEADLAEAILELEGGGREHTALVLGSGMAAMTLACLALNPGRRKVVGSPALYGGTLALLTRELPALGLQTQLVDLDDAAATDAALDGAGLLVAETISNPAMRVADIPRLARACGEHGVPLLVDNTFASPVLCRPLELGAAAVVESGTKYLGGHSDAMVGTLVLGVEAGARARSTARVLGATAAPLDCWLVLRGMRTLGLRVEAASRSAMRIAHELAALPSVDRVHYPGLEPDTVPAGVLDGGFGAMLSFTLAGGEAAAVRACSRLRLIAIMPSLGHVSTTVSHPASTSHRGLGDDAMAAAGTGPGMIRLSVGIEDVEDLLEDLCQALA